MSGPGAVLLAGALLLAPVPGTAAGDSPCRDCHQETGLDGSVHAGLTCDACHAGMGPAPHGAEAGAGREPCRSCHAGAASSYSVHGHLDVLESPAAPTCADCHGSHGIRRGADPLSQTHPDRLSETCGSCHGRIDLVRRFDLDAGAVDLYRRSVHGGPSPAATCIDCHADPDSPHVILWAGSPESTICFFELAGTCGRCHQESAADYQAGAHGRSVGRGDTDAPLCSTCHGEHGIVRVGAPESPVAPTRVAGTTCAPCHQSVTMAEKYGLNPGVAVSFFDSYHGMKSMVGDVAVADCADCHGAHEVRGPRDPRSRVHPDRVAATCRECHEGMSEELARIPIHGLDGRGGFPRTATARTVEWIYIVAIVVIIGLMALHWILDLARRLVDVARERPRVRRMRPSEVLQHALLAASFIVLALTGFALAYERAFWVDWLFGWEGGFELRRLLHRVAACLFLGVVAWHMGFLAATRRGREFFRDIFPRRQDFVFFFHRLAFNLGLRAEAPRAGRFSYVEKAEYWALVWGAAVMVLTGAVLWLDNLVLQWAPLGVLDLAWVVHFWEAWLATLAIAVWHLYSTIFNPEVYPMNPSWLTGSMPERQYAAEHPGHLEQARKE